MNDSAPTELTREEYGACILAVTKVQLIWRAVKAGLPVNITKDNFGFCDITDEEEMLLVTKLANNQELLWLKQQHSALVPNGWSEVEPE